MSKRKHFVLFSGGLDSAVVFWRVLDEARKQGEEVEAVGIDYGQRHAVELTAAGQLCDEAEVFYDVLEIPAELMAGALLASDKPIPEQTYADLPHGMSPTYVPFRNGLMLSLLAAKAQKWVMQQVEPGGRFASIYIGSHAEDAENDAYPDCSVEFMNQMGNAIRLGTYGMVELVTPLITLKKAEVIKMGAELGVPFEQTWSCYKGGHVHCGKCMTCNARHQGFAAAGIKDPTLYAA
jgi:7-cyano-7-deazaguanine synthase